MSGTKKLEKYVTEARMAQVLSQFAKAADATFAIRLAAMEQELRDEFGASRIVAALDEGTHEGNHLAPTPAEGAE